MTQSRPPRTRWSKIRPTQKKMAHIQTAVVHAHIPALHPGKSGTTSQEHKKELGSQVAVPFERGSQEAKVQNARPTFPHARRLVGDAHLGGCCCNTRRDDVRRIYAMLLRFLKRQSVYDKHHVTLTRAHYLCLRLRNERLALLDVLLEVWQARRKQLLLLGAQWANGVDLRDTVGLQYGQKCQFYR